MTTIDPQQAMPTTTAGPVTATAQSTAPPFAATTVASRLRSRWTQDLGVVRWGDVAVGAAFETEEAAAGLIGAVRQAAARPGRRMAALAERGALERARGRRRTTEAVQATVTAVTTSPLIDRVVDVQVERVLRPVVLAVLDDVLLLLQREPDRLQSLLRGQRDSMVDELVNRIRTGAAASDAAVDRLTSQVLRRAPRPAPAPPAAGP